jgi:hypothetical protein
MIFGFYTRAYVKHMEAEIATWRVMWRHERQRADLLMDRMLADKGVVGVTGPLIPDEIAPPSPEDLKDLDEINRAGEVPLV